MQKRKMPDEYKLILLCARLDIGASTQQKIREIISKPLNWDKIINTCHSHQILPLLYYTLERLNFQNLIPQDILALMKKCYYLNLKRNSKFEREISLILKLANNAGISIIPLKGFSLIQTLYSNPALRVIADVDILIKQNEIQGIKNILIQMGFQENIKGAPQKNPNDYRHMAIFSKKISSNLPMLIEIHGILAYARPYEIKIPYLWERAYKKTINGQGLLCLSLEDTFLSLALHLRSHTRRLSLKFIVDIAELLNINGDKFDWHYIKELAKNNHIIATTYFFLYLAKELLNAAVSPEIINEFSPNIIKNALMRFAINRYNFFALKKWQGIFLRLLLFDSPIDFILYLWRVSFLESFVAKRFFIKTKENAAKIAPIQNIVETKK